MVVLMMTYFPAVFSGMYMGCTQNAPIANIYGIPGYGASGGALNYSGGALNIRGGQCIPGPAFATNINAWIQFIKNK